MILCSGESLEAEVGRWFPVLPFLAFLEFLVFSLARNSLFFSSVFPFFSRDFRGSAGLKNPCFFGGFPCLFPKKQGKEGQGFGGIEAVDTEFPYRLPIVDRGAIAVPLFADPVSDS